MEMMWTNQSLSLVSMCVFISVCSCTVEEVESFNSSKSLTNLHVLGF